jgi:hypothetical protein
MKKHITFILLLALSTFIFCFISVTADSDNHFSDENVTFIQTSEIEENSSITLTNTTILHVDQVRSVRSIKLNGYSLKIDSGESKSLTVTGSISGDADLLDIRDVNISVNEGIHLTKGDISVNNSNLTMYVEYFPLHNNDIYKALYAPNSISIIGSHVDIYAFNDNEKTLTGIKAKNLTIYGSTIDVTAERSRNVSADTYGIQVEESVTVQNSQANVNSIKGEAVSTQLLSVENSTLNAIGTKKGINTTVATKIEDNSNVKAKGTIGITTKALYLNKGVGILIPENGTFSETNNTVVNSSNKTAKTVYIGPTSTQMVRSLTFSFDNKDLLVGNPTDTPTVSVAEEGVSVTNASWWRTPDNTKIESQTFERAEEIYLRIDYKLNDGYLLSLNYDLSVNNKLDDIIVYEGYIYFPVNVYSDINSDSIQIFDFSDTQHPIGSADGPDAVIGYYTGEELDPIVFLKDNGKLITLSSKSYDRPPVNAGNYIITVTGKNYTGSRKIPLRILPAEITKATADQNYSYTGKPVIPNLTVQAGDLKVPATDYDVTFTNNTNAGTAVAIVKGKGNFTGSARCNFTITPISITEVTAENQYYTGKAVKTNLTVKAGNTVIPATDYTATYKNNTKKGTATVTVTGKGNTEGTASCTFTIKAWPSIAVKKLSKNKTTMTVQWKRVSDQNITGIQIQYSTNSKFRNNNKTVTVNKKQTSKKITKLKAKKKYYVRMRLYKTVEGTTYVSGWSKSKNIKL